MKTLLILTTLDVPGRRNNREHAALRELAPRFDRTIVVFRQRAAAGKPALALLQGRITRRDDAAVTFVAVDPPLNPPEGAVRGATTQRPSANLLTRLAGQGLDTLAILRDRLTIAALSHAAAQALAGLDPADITCEAFGPWAAEAARHLRRQGRLAAYAYIDRDFEPGFVSSPLRRRWVTRMEARAARTADLTLSIGQRLAARHTGTSRHHPVLSPTGVDVGFFTAPQRPPGPLHIVYVGEVAPWSALDLLIAALQHPGLSQARLSLRGPALPGYRSQLLGLVASSGLGARFDWPGDVDRSEIPPLLAQANLGYCLFRPTPLRCHAAPLKLLEYFAAGLPAIAAPGSEAGDLVARSGAGLLCAPTSAALADALIGFEATPAATRDRMADAAHATALAHDWRDIFAREAVLLAGLGNARATGSAVPASQTYGVRP
ncbi:glycosyltransferase [Rhodobacter ferrooxidans]|uniref:Glycosyl transferase group 1 n=1 Tax=Rhodobacter ferrooxidans TaxID=371731 RepID=C8S4A1_9RHOB|nr:glycosyltransferase [Rhodobacter sp. SW2]EEW24160.1 glycosyl transferase group 1 [Rhodobacter sp. SW2]